MDMLRTLTHFIGGHPLPEEHDGPASRLRLVAVVCAVSAVLCALYGLAAGSGHPALMAANLYKMPMVVLLSAASCLPAGLLTWKLIGSEQRASDLVIGVASGLLTGSLVLAVLAPLVALYYQSSTWLGPALALGTASIATLTAMAITVRAIWTRRKGSVATALAPVVVMSVVQLATLAQLIAVAAPILYEETVFDGGMDRMLGG